MPGMFAVVAVALIGAVGVDRLLLACERRGWIYWRRRRRSSTSAGNAMLQVHSLFEPDKRHIVEERDREAAAIELADDDGA